MRNILIKEIRLSASSLSYWFIAFGLMFFLPGYPVLCGAFFVTLGIFNSFQNARETGDILFSALLPIAKRDVVKGKFCFSVMTELCGASLMAVAAVLRMTVLSEVAAYRNNALMNGNLFALGFAFLIFGVFNLVFIGGFFKTSYKLAKPFLSYTITAFVLIGIAETLHHLPGLEILNSFGTDDLGTQVLSLLAGMLLCVGLTLFSLKRSEDNFEKTDL